MQEVDSTPPSTVLIVDDTPENLNILGGILQPHYHVRVTGSGADGLAIAASEPRPDLILLDYMMPGLDGIEVLRRLQNAEFTRQIPVIFVTASDGPRQEEAGLRLGAVDFIAKPVIPAILLARVRNQLELKRARDRLALDKEWLEREVQRRTAESTLVRNLSVSALACVAEARDDETGQHVARTREYVRLLGEYLACQARFRDALSVERRDMVVKAAALHDLGKVGIPDAILLKPGRLTADEFEVIKKHPAIGARAIRKAMDLAVVGMDEEAVAQAAQAFEFLECAHEICLRHHEKWNGTGYPNGIAGNAIPIPARLMALADVFDALTTPRIYKAAMTFTEAETIIREGSGEHFDPDVVDAFVACREAFRDACQSYARKRSP